jgi:hypothetical protein
MNDLVAEASTLGWRVGFRPGRLFIHQGKIFIFQRTEFSDDESEILAWIYRAEDGTKLTVFND